MKYLYHNNSLLCLLIALSSVLYACGDDSDDATVERDFNLEQPTKTDFACSDCDFIVDDWEIDGDELGIEPGQVICLSSGATFDRGVKFVNLSGTADNPIVIRNCDGQAVIASEGSYGVLFAQSENFRFLGDGDTNSDYGIKVSTPSGFFVTFEQFTDKFECSLIEVEGYEKNGQGDRSGFAGIGIKTSPYQDCETFRDAGKTAWIMENISLNNCYVHDVGGEGFYIGHGWYPKDEQHCDFTTYPHSIHGIRVFNNVIENVGNDGIQIKNSDEDCAVYNNYVTGFGKNNNGAHNEGILIAGGTLGKFYNNFVTNGSGNGIQLFSQGQVDVYNNIVANVGEYGIFSADNESSPRIGDGYFNMFNNTLLECGRGGLCFYNNEGGVKRFYNNLVLASDPLVVRGAELDSGNNILAESMDGFGFDENYKPSSDSRAVDGGADLSEFDIEIDFENNDRPAGSGYDVGAYEVN